MQKDSKQVRARTRKQKELIIEQLRKTPIVQLACEKVSIGRATFYRWKKSDSRFRKASEVAILEGAKLVNDMAESQLLSAIRDRNLTAIIFWLKHHKAIYETRIKVSHTSRQDEESLNKREKEIIEKALELIAKENIKPKLKGDTNENS